MPPQRRTTRSTGPANATYLDLKPIIAGNPRLQQAFDHILVQNKALSEETRTLNLQIGRLKREKDEVVRQMNDLSTAHRKNEKLLNDLATFIIKFQLPPELKQELLEHHEYPLDRINRDAELPSLEQHPLPEAIPDTIPQTMMPQNGQYEHHPFFQHSQAFPGGMFYSQANPGVDGNAEDLNIPGTDAAPWEEFLTNVNLNVNSS